MTDTEKLVVATLVHAMVTKRQEGQTPTPAGLAKLYGEVAAAMREAHHFENSRASSP